MKVKPKYALFITYNYPFSMGQKFSRAIKIHLSPLAARLIFTQYHNIRMNDGKMVQSRLHTRLITNGSGGATPQSGVQ